MRSTIKKRCGRSFQVEQVLEVLGFKMAAVVGIIIRRRRISSSSSSSLDDEEFFQQRKKRKLRPRITDYADVVGRYADNEFKSHFRMSKSTFEYLVNIIRGDLIRKVNGCPTIPAEKQLMIALWKMATSDSYRSVCDRFNVGKATGLRAVRRVTYSLHKRAARWIQWPVGDRAITVMQQFEASSGFPRVIGAIDGTHIRIDAPQENAPDYVNRKHFHSIQLQLVCDSNMLITHCYTGHPGSVHDQRVFRLSDVANFVEDAEKFPMDSHLLGDAAYELHEHLLVPFRDNGHLDRTAKQI
ncbi:putative nuclease HARBI1 [Photinus pyralis]|nr:putative nuclease HARBI1 isoform X2 [Photinus pyralis]XP_031341459.1 putative nuclease HARBI1 [Photinus pyralis]